MNKTAKTIIIIAGSVVGLYVGYQLYLKHKATIATTPAPAPGSTGIASGIATGQQIAAGAGGLLTQLGNLFGAHSTTATTTGQTPNPAPVTTTGTNVPPTLDDGDDAGADDNDIYG